MKRTVVTQAQRDAAVKAYTEGAQVSVLAKEYRVSRPAIYQWIAAARGGTSKSLQERISILEQQVADLHQAMMESVDI